MITRTAKVLLLTAFFAMAGISGADVLVTNHVAELHLQITQTSTGLLNQSSSKTSLADLQSFVALAQKYYSARKEIEEPLFRQRLQENDKSGHGEDALLQEQQSPSVEQTLIAIFQQYISLNLEDNNLVALTQLRNLLRQLQRMDQGHLSGGTWLYNSSLASFAIQNLQPLDKRIIQTSTASAIALRKKHQYISAIKLYKTLLTDYADTPHGKEIKVLLDAATVEDYNYQATLALGQHDYKIARVALKQIITLYPDSDYSVAAEKAMQATVPAAVSYFKKEGTAVFHPEGHSGVPQTKAADFFSKMYEEDPDGPQADYATYYWARALGTEGKIKEALDHLQDFDKKFPRSKMRPDALFLQGFLLASTGINQYAKAADLMTEFARLYPHHQQIGDALWYATFYHAYDNHFKEALDCLEQLKKYPKDKHQKYIAHWESTFRNKIQTGGKWP